MDSRRHIYRTNFSHPGRFYLILTAALTLAGAARTEEAAADLEPVTVIAVSPLPGSGLDIDKTPANVQSLSPGDLARDKVASTTGALVSQLGSVNISDDLDDPFQPDILIRGFEASPVLGTPQGIAVYQNGARINEAFGETVNWDLIPDIAIHRLTVLGADPVFGLNALGGALVLDMKTGFTDPGGDASIYGGSFGQRAGAVEYGVNSGAFGVYVAGRALNEDGWREFSPDRIRQFYGDVSARSDRLTLDLSLTAADNKLLGGSATPVQELAVNRSLVFTSPQVNADKVAFVVLNGSYSATPRLSLQGAAYFRGFWQSVINGNTTSYTACTTASDIGLLCQGDGRTPLTNSAGETLPDISDNGALPIGENDGEKIDSTGIGGSLQVTLTAPVAGRDNHLSAGASIDHAVTDFSSDTQVGVINSDLVVQPSGLYVNTPDSSLFAGTPVSLGATTTYYGLYATDTINLTPQLSITASGRYNIAQIDLADRKGTNLNGSNTYRHFNPAFGAAWKVARWLTVYGGYSEGNRAPNPSEIECSNPLIPCLLPSSLASDPPTLRQVVSHSWEAGFRGTFATSGRGDVTWNAGVFRTNVDDDIYGAATSLSAGYFQNIGGTRREGMELGARYRTQRLSAYASVSYISATFCSALILPSPSNPFQNAAGNIQVAPGDQLPGIPRYRIKFGADYQLLRGWSIGGSLAAVGGVFYVGDQSNQLARIPGYTVVNLHSTLRLSRALSLFAIVDNALNAHYSTYGVLGDPTGIGAPGVPSQGVDNRFQSPAAPVSVYGGMKVAF